MILYPFQNPFFNQYNQMSQEHLDTFLCNRTPAAPAYLGGGRLRMARLTGDPVDLCQERVMIHNSSDNVATVASLTKRT